MNTVRLRRDSSARRQDEWRQPGTPNGELFTKTDSETGDVTTYYYDALGNLLSVDLPDGRLIEYVIDGQNRRIGKKIDGVLTKAWLYKDQLKPIAELDGSGNLTARFVYGSKTNTPDLVMKYNAGLVTTYRVISDHLGSPVMAVNVNNSADVPFKAEYTAFGERTVTTNAASENWMPFGFAGGLYDADTELVRFGARDYDAVTGRWTAKDPIGWSGGDTNLFGYVFANPINATDPAGTDTYRCIQPLHAMPDEGSKSGWESWLNPLYHQFVCVRDTNGNTTCGGQDRTGSWFRSPGKPSNDTWPAEGHGECQNLDDHACVDNCMLERIKDPRRPMYGIGPQGTDCQEWADDTVAACQSQCGSYQ